MEQVEALCDWSFDSPAALPAKSEGFKEGTCLGIRNHTARRVGYWRRVYGVAAGGHYGFSVKARVAGCGKAVTMEHVSAFVTWKADESKAMLKREYLEMSGEGGALLLSRCLKAPEKARFAELSLCFKWMSGDALWSDAEVRELPAPPPRTPLVVTTKIGPPCPSTKEGNTGIMDGVLSQIEKSLGRPDLVVLPENLLTRNVCGDLEMKGEAIPGGPFFQFLSGWAKRLNSYIYTTIVENDGGFIHNTGFMLGRDGSLLGKYRKVHLTLSEAEVGMIPGTEYKVFDLDFGKVGVATCWDNWFSETARILRLKGAEMMLFPLAGDGDPIHWEHVWRTRALDNGLHVVASTSLGEDGRCPARIVAPSGEVLAECREKVGFAAARIDLNRDYCTYWLSVGPCDGEGRSLYCAERRPSTYADLV